MLLVVLVWAFVRNMDEGLVWGFIGGLTVDLLSGGPLGATALALSAVALLAGQQWGQELGPQVVRLIFVTFVGVVVYHLILLAALAWAGHTVNWGFSLLSVAGPSALLNMVLAPFVRPPLAWLERRSKREGVHYDAA